MTITFLAWYINSLTKRYPYLTDPGADTEKLLREIIDHTTIFNLLRLFEEYQLTQGEQK